MPSEALGGPRGSRPILLTAPSLALVKGVGFAPSHRIVVAKHRRAHFVVHLLGLGREIGWGAYFYALDGGQGLRPKRFTPSVKFNLHKRHESALDLGGLGEGNNQSYRMRCESLLLQRIVK